MPLASNLSTKRCWSEAIADRVSRPSLASKWLVAFVLLPLCLSSSGCLVFHRTGGDDVVRTSLVGSSSGGGSIVQANGVLRSSARAASRGVKLFQAGELPGAAKAFEQAISIDPANGTAHNNLGLVRFDQHRLADAADHFSTAAEFLPEDAKPLNNLGMTLEAGGRTIEAIDYYEQAAMLQPRNPLYLGNLVRAKIRMGERDDLVLSQLQELAMIEHRPEWVRWTQDQLALDFNPLLDRGGDSTSGNPFGSNSESAKMRDSNNDGKPSTEQKNEGLELYPSGQSIHDEYDLGPGESLMGEPTFETWPDSQIPLPEHVPTPEPTMDSLPEPFFIPPPMGLQ